MVDSGNRLIPLLHSQLVMNSIIEQTPARNGVRSYGTAHDKLANLDPCYNILQTPKHMLDHVTGGKRKVMTGWCYTGVITREAPRDLSGREVVRASDLGP